MFSDNTNGGVGSLASTAASGAVSSVSANNQNATVTNAPQSIIPTSAQNIVQNGKSAIQKAYNSSKGLLKIGAGVGIGLLIFAGILKLMKGKKHTKKGK